MKRSRSSDNDNVCSTRKHTHTLSTLFKRISLALSPVCTFSAVCIFILFFSLHSFTSRCRCMCVRVHVLSDIIVIILVSCVCRLLFMLIIIIFVSFSTYIFHVYCCSAFFRYSFRKHSERRAFFTLNVDVFCFSYFFSSHFSHVRQTIFDQIENTYINKSVPMKKLCRKSRNWKSSIRERLPIAKKSWGVSKKGIAGWKKTARHFIMLIFAKVQQLFYSILFSIKKKKPRKI